jgi:hypothetical protein
MINRLFSAVGFDFYTGVRKLSTANATSTANVLAGGFGYRSGHSDRSNAIARRAIESLKSGDYFKGIVLSQSIAESNRFSWIAIELPLQGERQVLVRNEPNLRIGQEVFVECVPNPLKPGRYSFRIARS